MVMEELPLRDVPQELREEIAKYISDFMVGFVKLHDTEFGYTIGYQRVIYRRLAIIHLTGNQTVRPNLFSRLAFFYPVCLLSVDPKSVSQIHQWMSNPVSICKLPKVKMFPSAVPIVYPNRESRLVPAFH